MQYFDDAAINKIRKGVYSAVYFNRTQQILLAEKNLKKTTMQIFQKQDNMTVAGIDIVAQLFKEAAGYFQEGTWVGKWDTLTMEALQDGDTISSWESVIHINGPYAYFAHLESVYLGILARATKIATITKKVVTAAKNKPVVFFADRFDYYLNQPIDGYAAKTGGIAGFSTEAQVQFLNGQAMGTLPHALIAMYEGNTVAAAQAFAKKYPDIPLIVLVDFENDCVKTSLEVAKTFGHQLYGVRLDTSEKLIDLSLQSLELREKEEEIHGVNPQLVRNVRSALDKEGFQHVKIIVSGGFTEEKIKRFEEQNTPVDMYGVGSSLIRGYAEFTADIVQVEGKSLAKAGRIFTPNPRFHRVEK